MEVSDPLKRAHRLCRTWLSAAWYLISFLGHQMAVKGCFDELSKNESQTCGHFPSLCLRFKTYRGKYLATFAKPKEAFESKPAKDIYVETGWLCS